MNFRPAKNNLYIGLKSFEFLCQIQVVFPVPAVCRESNQVAIIPDKVFKNILSALYSPVKKFIMNFTGFIDFRIVLKRFDTVQYSGHYIIMSFT